MKKSTILGGCAICAALLGGFGKIARDAEHVGPKIVTGMRAAPAFRQQGSSTTQPSGSFDLAAKDGSGHAVMQGNDLLMSGQLDGTHYAGAGKLSGNTMTMRLKSYDGADGICTFTYNGFPDLKRSLPLSIPFSGSCEFKRTAAVFHVGMHGSIDVTKGAEAADLVVKYSFFDETDKLGVVACRVRTTDPSHHFACSEE